MTKKTLLFLVIILIIADITYSFLQHYNTPFDGDMAGGIVPAEDVRFVLNNPLGLDVFSEKDNYPNPNKFFCHWSFYQYFNNAPHLFHSVTDPITSAYLSCAIAKTAIQIIIIAILALYISGNWFSAKFFFAAFLITPLFQTNGYRGSMGIIDPATTYTFFYALPSILILIYFTPLFFKHFYNYSFKRMKTFKLLWIPLALITSLSGPLNPGIALIVCLLMIIQIAIKTTHEKKSKNLLKTIKQVFHKIPGDYYFYLLPIALFSIYSLYLGQFNSINLTHEYSLLELYSKLPIGIFKTLTLRLGYPLLLLSIAVNTAIIHYKINSDKGKELLKTLKWIGIFSIIYILLLPLGGYRDYRPFILRYDTIIPITLSLFYIFGKSSIYIFHTLSNRQRYLYAPFLIMILFIFTIADTPKFGKKNCEEKALMHIAASQDSIVLLNNNCKILSWTTIQTPKESQLICELLKNWKIIQRDKLFYQNSDVLNNAQKQTQPNI